MTEIKSKKIHSYLGKFATLSKSLPIYRVIYSLFILTVMLPRYLWISDYPDTFFFPRVSISLFFTGFPDITFFYILNFLLILSLLALLVGYRTFYSSISVAFLIFLGNSFEYSFGKINHDIFLILIPLIFSTSWGGRIVESNDTTESKTWSPLIFALLIGLAMLTAAIPKINGGWLDPSVSPLKGILINNYFVRDRQTIMASFLLSQDIYYIFKFLEYFTLIIELGFIFTFFSLRYFRLICSLACFFHFGVHFLMGISFTPNILAYAAFVNWHYLYRFNFFENLFNRLNDQFKNKGIFILIVAAIPIWLLYIYFDNPFTMDYGLSIILGGSLITSILMIIAVIISMIYIYSFLFAKSFAINEVQHP